MVPASGMDQPSRIGLAHIASGEQRHEELLRHLIRAAIGSLPHGSTPSLMTADSRYNV